MERFVVRRARSPQRPRSARPQPPALRQAPIEALRAGPGGARPLRGLRGGVGGVLRPPRRQTHLQTVVLLRYS